MLILHDQITCKHYHVLRFDNVKSGDTIMIVDPEQADNITISVADDDFPEEYASLILEEISVP